MEGMQQTCRVFSLLEWWRPKFFDMMTGKGFYYLTNKILVGKIYSRLGAAYHRIHLFILKDGPYFS